MKWYILYYAAVIAVFISCIYYEVFTFKDFFLSGVRILVAVLANA